MSGVIDRNGTQWERCNSCTKFVVIEDLRYESPTEKYEFGRDLCFNCYEGHYTKSDIKRIREKENAKIREYEETKEYKEFLNLLKNSTWVEVSENCWQMVANESGQMK